MVDKLASLNLNYRLPCNIFSIFASWIERDELINQRLKPTLSTDLWLLHLLISLILCAQSCRRLGGILKSLDMKGWSKLRIASWSRGKVLQRLSNQLYATSFVHLQSHLFCHIYMTLKLNSVILLCISSLTNFRFEYSRHCSPLFCWSFSKLF